jgi:hypothetical protein
MEILRDSWKIEMGDVGRFMRDTEDWNDIQERQGEILGDPGMYREIPDER